MNTDTYNQLPADIKQSIGDGLVMDESLPTGVVQVVDLGGKRDVTVAQFVKRLRSRRKQQRQNKKAGRR